MTVAQLGIEVRSDADKATRELALLTTSAEKAEAATKRLTAGSNAQATASRTVSTAAQQAATATNALVARSTAAASSVQSLTAAVNAEASALRNVTQASNAAANANAQFVRGMNNSRMAAAGVAAQLSDIGVSLASGASPFLVAIQQGSQLQYALGAQGVRGALSTVAAGFTSLLNPVSLVTLAVVGLGTYAVSSLTSWFTSGAKTVEQLKEQEALVGRVVARWGEALPALAAYNKEAERAKEIADIDDAGKVTSDEALTQAQAALAEISNNGQRLLQQLRLSGTVTGEAIDALDRALRKTRSEMGDGAKTAENTKAVFAALNGVLAEGGSAVQEYQTRFSTLSADLTEATGRSKALEDQTKRLTDALRVQDQINKFPGLPTLSPLSSAGGSFLNEQQLQEQRAIQERAREATEELSKLGRIDFSGSIGGLSRLGREVDGLSRSTMGVATGFAAIDKGLAGLAHVEALQAARQELRETETAIAGIRDNLKAMTDGFGSGSAAARDAFQSAQTAITATADAVANGGATWQTLETAIEMARQSLLQFGIDGKTVNTFIDNVVRAALATEKLEAQIKAAAAAARTVQINPNVSYTEYPSGQGVYRSNYGGDAAGGGAMRSAPQGQQDPWDRYRDAKQAYNDANPFKASADLTYDVSGRDVTGQRPASFGEDGYAEEVSKHYEQAQQAVSGLNQQLAASAGSSEALSAAAEVAGGHMVSVKDAVAETVPSIQLAQQAVTEIAGQAGGVGEVASQFTATATNAKAAQDAIDQIKASIDALPAEKTIVINVVERNTSSVAGAAAQENAAGGHIRGPGTGTSDSILSWLSNGEYVMRAASVAKYGVGFMDALNRGTIPGFADGGSVGGATPVALSNMGVLSEIVINTAQTVDVLERLLSVTNTWSDDVLALLSSLQASARASYSGTSTSEAGSGGGVFRRLPGQYINTGYGSVKISDEDSPGRAPGYSQGGVIPPIGSGSADTRFIQMMTRPDETISVHTPQQRRAFVDAIAGAQGGGGGMTNTFNINVSVPAGADESQARRSGRAAADETRRMLQQLMDRRHG